MKHLNKKQLNKAPLIVHHVYMCGVYNIPIGYKIYNECIEKYPEYFEDEIKSQMPKDEFDKLWDSYFPPIKDE
jgi:hypothetical protein